MKYGHLISYSMNHLDLDDLEKYAQDTETRAISKCRSETKNGKQSQ